MKAALGDNIDIYLQDFFSAYGNDRRYWIAYSGGLDSHVLLHACNKLKPAYQLQLQAIHVNHGLSPNANSWMQHCHSKKNLPTPPIRKYLLCPIAKSLS